MEFLEEKQKTVERLTQKLEERCSLEDEEYCLCDFKIGKIDAAIKVQITKSHFIFSVGYKNNLSRSSRKIGFGKNFDTLKLTEKAAMNFIRRAETIKNIYETMGHFGESEVCFSYIKKQNIYFCGHKVVDVYFTNEDSPVNFCRNWDINIYSIELKDFLSIDSKEKADVFLKKNKRK